MDIDSIARKPLTVREQLVANSFNVSGLEHYLERMDLSVYNALKRMQNPTVRDFETLFHKFEVEYFMSHPAILRVAANMIIPHHQRMLKALSRYTT